MRSLTAIAGIALIGIFSLMMMHNSLPHNHGKEGSDISEQTHYHSHSHSHSHKDHHFHHHNHEAESSVFLNGVQKLLADLLHGHSRTEHGDSDTHLYKNEPGDLNFEGLSKVKTAVEQFQINRSAYQKFLHKLPLPPLIRGQDLLYITDGPLRAPPSVS